LDEQGADVDQRADIGSIGGHQLFISEQMSFTNEHCVDKHQRSMRP